MSTRLYVPGTSSVQKSHWTLWNWSLRQLWATVLVLDTEPRPPERAAGTLNCWLMSPAPLPCFEGRVSLVISALALHTMVSSWFSWLLHLSSHLRRAGAGVTGINRCIWHMVPRNQTQVIRVIRQMLSLTEPCHQPHLLFDTQSLIGLELIEVRQDWQPESSRNPPPQN